MKSLGQCGRENLGPSGVGSEMNDTTGCRLRDEGVEEGSHTFAILFGSEIGRGDELSGSNWEVNLVLKFEYRAVLGTVGDVGNLLGWNNTTVDQDTRRGHRTGSETDTTVGLNVEGASSPSVDIFNQDNSHIVTITDNLDDFGVQLQ